MGLSVDIIAEVRSRRNGKGAVKTMKLSRWEAAILAVAALFLSFTAGWFLRGSVLSDPIWVETRRLPNPAQAGIALPEPTAAPVQAPPEETEEPAESLPVPAAEGKININTADAAALRDLPGIGEKRAESIIADREQNGPFRFPEDITRVKGIGEEILAGIIDQITTEETP